MPLVQPVLQQAGATGVQDSAVLQGIANLPVHLFHRRLVYQGADGIGGIHAVAGPQRRYALLQRLEKSRQDRALHENAIGADTGLAGIEELDQRHPLGGVHRVGIVENDKRCMTPQFHGEALELRRAIRRDLLAHRGRTGKGNLPDQRIGAELRPDRRRFGGRHQVDHAGRKARLMQYLEDRHGTQRRRLGGLEHYRATRRQGRRQLAREHGDRIVPGGDRGDHPHRTFLHQEALVAARRGNGLAVNTLGLFREPQQKIGGILHLVARRFQGLALLPCHQLRQAGAALQHQAMGSVQAGGALVGAASRPGREGVRRRGDGGSRGIPVAVRDTTYLLAVGGVEHREGVGGGDPVTVDVHRLLLRNGNKPIVQWRRSG